MRTTSAEAYQQIQDEGLLKDSQWVVYDVLYRHGPLTQNEAHERLKANPKFRNKPTITPRFAELERLGVIHTLGKRECTVSHRRCLQFDVTLCLPVKPTQRVKQNVGALSREVQRLQLENAALRLRLSRWGRPTKEEVVARSAGCLTTPMFAEVTCG